MKPYGRVKNVKGGTWKHDVHPPKGYINWWEDMCTYVSRSTLNQMVRKEIETELNEPVPEWPKGAGCNPVIRQFESDRALH